MLPERKTASPCAEDNTTAGALGVLSSDLGERTRVGPGEGSLPLNPV